MSSSQADNLDAATIPVPMPVPARTGLAVLNAAAVLVAALYFGRPLLVPLVLAALLAFVLAPIVGLLQRARLGKAPSVLIAVALAFAIIFGIGAVVAGQVTTLVGSLPSYQATIQQKVASLSVGGEVLERLNATIQSFIGGMGMGMGGGAPAAVAAAPAAVAPATSVDAATALYVARTVVTPLFSPLATLGVVVVFLIFVLMSREDLRDRLVRLVGRQDLHRTILAMNDAARRLSRYFLIQLALNSGFGTFIGMGLWWVGLPNPVLWGILAGLMRFVPFIGSFIAVVPPLLLALAVAPGWSFALIVLLLFIGSDMVMGQVIEPLLYGHNTGLSPLAVILSAAFWAFLWGPVGLLIATPLTVCLVVIGRHVEPLAFLDVMLGDQPPLDPPEIFYQRAIEGNRAELARQAARAVAAASLSDYYDHVALPGLRLAQADLSRDALPFEQLEAIHNQVAALLAGLGQAGQGPAAPAWHAEGSIVCIPGRGPLDDLAATMAMQVLRGAGFGAEFLANQVLGASQAGRDLGAARLCCLSVLDQGSNASGIRYLLKRIGRLMPNAAVVVCLWRAEAASPMLAALRSGGDQETIVLSLGELAALVKAVSARRAEPVAA